MYIVNCNVLVYMYLQCGYILLLAVLTTFLCSRYLSDEDDGVSEAMIPFAVQYLSVLKVPVHTQVTYKCTYMYTHILIVSDI